MTTTDNIINGWEYVTDVKPNIKVLEQKLQDTYLMEFNLAYHKFLKSLCIEKEYLDNIVNNKNYDTVTDKLITKYKFIIDTTEDNDIINSDSE